MKKIAAKIKAWLKDKFDKGFDIAKKNSLVAVQVTNKLKEVINSPIADLVTALIPGELDNELKYKLRKVLPEVAAKIAITHNIIQATEDPTTALTKIKEYIESLGGGARRDWWVLFSANVMEGISDGEVSYSDLIKWTQMAYDELYNNKA